MSTEDHVWITLLISSKAAHAEFPGELIYAAHTEGPFSVRINTGFTAAAAHVGVRLVFIETDLAGIWFDDSTWEAVTNYRAEESGIPSTCCF